MRKVLILILALGLWVVGMPAGAEGPSGSYECHVKDDDCDRAIDEDTGTATDDIDGDGLIDEDDPGDTDGDGNPDDDGDGAVDEDVSDDDHDGAVDEDAPGNAVNNPEENQVDCDAGDATSVGGVVYVYAGTNGAEVCDENSTTPIDGRVVVNADEGYVAIDGDNSNPGPGNGYARFDPDGPHCGDENNQDSGADQSDNDQADCG